MKDQRKAEEIAAQRVQLLSPLLADGLDSAKVKQIKVNFAEWTIRQQDAFSLHTLYLPSDTCPFLLDADFIYSA